MARIEERVDIKRSADKVFTYTTDAKTWTKWQSTFPEAEQTSQGPVGVGTTFKGTIHMMGLTMTNWYMLVASARSPGVDPAVPACSGTMAD